MTQVSTITNVQYERADVDFADGSRVILEENDLGLILTRTAKTLIGGKFRESEPNFVGNELGLDTEYNFLIVGMNWCTEGDGRVILPTDVLRWDPVSSKDREMADYDRVAYIDSAIEALERAKAVLMMASLGREAQA